jgi:hypothetical protein
MALTREEIIRIYDARKAKRKTYSKSIIEVAFAIKNLVDGPDPFHGSIRDIAIALDIPYQRVSAALTMTRTTFWINNVGWSFPYSKGNSERLWFTIDRDEHVPEALRRIDYRVSHLVGWLKRVEAQNRLCGKLNESPLMERKITSAAMNIKRAIEDLEMA